MHACMVGVENNVVIQTTKRIGLSDVHNTVATIIGTSSLGAIESAFDPLTPACWNPLVLWNSPHPDASAVTT